MVYFEKSQPAPDCLETEKKKANGSYRCGDVLDRLKTDFKNKCYICGLKEPSTINVEHFRPHRGDRNLKFQWENLFWSCGHCNNTKNDNYTDIIDCTDLKEDVENRLKITIKPFPEEKPTIEALDQNPATRSTVELLNAVFNGTSKLKTTEACNLRNKLLNEIYDFQKYLINYYSEGFDSHDKASFLAKIKRHLKKSSNFTAFKRWIIRENEVMRADFEQYFD